MATSETKGPIGWVVVCWRRDLLVAAYMNDSGKPYTREEAEHEAADLNEPDASSSFTYTVEPLGSSEEGERRFTLEEIDVALYDAQREWDSKNMASLSDLMRKHLERDMSETSEEAKCSRCKVNPAEPDHTCPYAEEINDDHESLCDCCDACASECAADV